MLFSCVNAIDIQGRAIFRGMALSENMYTARFGSSLQTCTLFYGLAFLSWQPPNSNSRGSRFLITFCRQTVQQSNLRSSDKRKLPLFSDASFLAKLLVLTQETGKVGFYCVYFWRCSTNLTWFCSGLRSKYRVLI